MGSGADDGEPEVVRDDAAGRFAAQVGGEEIGFAEYERDGRLLTFTHTVVAPGDGRRGVGSLLVAAAMTAARDEGAQVLPECSFVRSWLGKHPDFLDLVPADRRADYGLPAA